MAWYRESARHSLAAQGIETTRKDRTIRKLAFQSTPRTSFPRELYRGIVYGQLKSELDASGKTKTDKFGVAGGLTANYATALHFGRGLLLHELPFVIVLDQSIKGEGVKPVEYTPEFFLKNPDVLRHTQTMLYEPEVIGRTPEEYEEDMIAFSTKTIQSEREFFSKKDIHYKPHIKALRLYLGKNEIKSFLASELPESKEASQLLGLSSRDRTEWTLSNWLHYSHTKKKAAKVIGRVVSKRLHGLPVEVYVTRAGDEGVGYATQSHHFKRIGTYQGGERK